MISYEEFVDAPRPESPAEPAPTKKAALREYAVWVSLHVGVLLLLATIGFTASRLAGPAPAVAADHAEQHTPAALTLAQGWQRRRGLGRGATA